MSIDCRKCIFFKITWEKENPYACKVFGFKSNEIPSVKILFVDGKNCLKFSPKTYPKKQNVNWVG